VTAAEEGQHFEGKNYAIAHSSGAENMCESSNNGSKNCFTDVVSRTIAIFLC